MTAPSRTMIVPPTEWLRGLVFGYSGAGKSHLLCTCREVPELLPAFIVSLDNNQATLRRMLAGATDVKLASCTTVDEAGRALAEASSGKYRFLGLDGAKSLYDLLLAFVAPPLPVGTGVLAKLPTDWRNPTLQDRGVVLEMMLRVGRALAQVPMHVVVTCLADDLMDESKSGQVSVMLPGKLRRLFPGMFDLTAYLDVRRHALKGGVKFERFLQLQPTTRVPEAKTCYGSTNDILEPTLAQLLQSMKGV